MGLARDQDWSDVVSIGKIHTIRRGSRWRKGMKIHFQIWDGKPYRSNSIQFAPVIECTGAQDIEIITGS